MAKSAATLRAPGLSQPGRPHAARSRGPGTRQLTPRQALDPRDGSGMASPRFDAVMNRADCLGGGPRQHELRAMRPDRVFATSRAAVLLSLHAGLVFKLISVNNITADKVGHVVAGFCYLKTKRFRSIRTPSGFRSTSSARYTAQGRLRGPEGRSARSLATSQCACTSSVGWNSLLTTDGAGLLRSPSREFEYFRVFTPIARAGYLISIDRNTPEEAGPARRGRGAPGRA